MSVRRSQRPARLSAPRAPRKRRIISITAALAVVAVAGAFGQSNAFKDILNVGVVDIARIFEVFFEESRAVRDLQDFHAGIVTEIQILSDEIQILKQRKLDAESRSEALELDEEIRAKESYLEEFKRVRYRQYRDMEESLQNDEFLVEITEAIQFVAIREGFSLVLEKSEIAALYVSDEVDITEDILEHLYSTVGKRYQ